MVLLLIIEMLYLGDNTFVYLHCVSFCVVVNAFHLLLLGAFVHSCTSCTMNNFGIVKQKIKILQNGDVEAFIT